MMEQMAAAGQSMGGSEEIEMETDEEGNETGNFVVKAKAVMFPILVHELIKGYYDILGAGSIPEDPVQGQMVKAKADIITNEIFDIIIGAYLWEKLLESYPEKVLIENMKIVQSLIFREFSMLPKNKFTSLAQRINSGDTSAYRDMEKIADDIINRLNQQDLDEILDSSYEGDDDDDYPSYSSDNDDDDDIDLSFLDDLGIDTSK
jgi:acyl carrier protein phosphodiesterase